MTTDISTLSRLTPDEGNTMLGIYADPRQPDRIIKMVDPTRDGYFAYAAWLLTNQERNPHFLRVYAVELLDPYRALITVERLEDGHTLDESVMNDASAIVSGYPPYSGSDPETMLMDAAHLIYKDLGPHWWGDLHRGNFMTRPDGTIVINDPLAGRKQF